MCVFVDFPSIFRPPSTYADSPTRVASTCHIFSWSRALRVLHSPPLLPLTLLFFLPILLLLPPSSLHSLPSPLLFTTTVCRATSFASPLRRSGCSLAVVFLIVLALFFSSPSRISPFLQDIHSPVPVGRATESRNECGERRGILCRSRGCTGRKGRCELGGDGLVTEFLREELGDGEQLDVRSALVDGAD
jgi:hypothetical protein